VAEGPSPGDVEASNPANTTRLNQATTKPPSSYLAVARFVMLLDVLTIDE
jgi:hypothetical protein